MSSIGEDTNWGWVNIIRLLRSLEFTEILYRAVGFAINFEPANIANSFDLAKQRGCVHIVGWQYAHFEMKCRPDEDALVVALVPDADKQQPRER